MSFGFFLWGGAWGTRLGYTQAVSYLPGRSLLIYIGLDDVHISRQQMYQSPVVQTGRLHML